MYINQPVKFSAYFVVLGKETNNSERANQILCFIHSNVEMNHWSVIHFRFEFAFMFSRHDNMSDGITSQDVWVSLPS